MKLDNLLSHRVLVLDYFTFLKKLQTIPVTDPSVSSLVSDAWEMLTASTCGKTLEIPREWYVLLDRILAYFDSPKNFFVYSGQQYELFLRFVLCVRDDLLGRKATTLRSLIATLDNTTGDEIDPLQTETNKNLVKLFLTDIYHDLMEGMTHADRIYREVSKEHQSLLYNNNPVKYKRNKELNTLVLQISQSFHHTIHKMMDLVQSGNIVENLQTSMVSPYFQFPYMTPVRLVESNTLDNIVSEYYGENPKKVPEYDHQQISMVLYSKKESIWTLEENKAWDRKQKCNYFAFLLYHAPPQLFFLLSKNPPETFLVLLPKEDAEDILSEGNPSKRIFIESVVLVSKSKCLYGFLGEV